MKITAVVCPYCMDTIFSRAHHDFRRCGCGKVAIDGGSQYIRVLWPTGDSSPKTFQLCVPMTRDELYYDWNYHIDAYGRLPAEGLEPKTDFRSVVAYYSRYGWGEKDAKSVDELARRFKVSVATVLRWAKGLSKPHRSRRENVVAYLEAKRPSAKEPK